MSSALRTRTLAPAAPPVARAAWPSPVNSRLLQDAPLQAVTGKDATFTIQLRDDNCAPVAGAADALLKVDVRGPSKPAALTVETAGASAGGDEDDTGAYQLRLRLPMSGAYQLHVNVVTPAGLRPIASSPIELKVGPPAAYAPLSFATGGATSSGVLGRENRFSVQLVDQLGTHWTKGGEKLTSTIRGPDGPFAPETTVVETRPGLFEIRYMAEQYGDHTLAVTLAGRHIAGSPFNILIAKDGAIPRNCTVEGAGITAMIAGQKSRFRVQARDAAGNDVGSAGSGEFEVRLERDGALMPWNVDWTKRDSIHEAEVVVPTAGAYLLHITLDNLPISGSPFPLLVSPGTISATRSELVISGLGANDSVVAGTEVGLACSGRDDFGNECGCVGVEYSAKGPTGEDMVLRVAGDSAVMRPQSSGRYIISASVAGVPVGSPVTILVTSSTTDPLRCQVSGHGLQFASVGSSASLSLIAFDGFGNRRTSGGDCVEAFWKQCDAVHNACVVDHDDGTYSISYTPHSPDVGQLEIRIRDISIPKSPFKISVLAPTVASKCTIESGVTSLEAGSVLSLRIAARDEEGRLKSCGGESGSFTVLLYTLCLFVNEKPVDGGKLVVQPGPAWPDACEVNVNSTCTVAGSLFDFTISTSDRHRNRTSSSLDIIAEGPTVCTADFVTGDDGAGTFSLRIPLPGKYRLSARISGAHIVGSPVEFEATSAPAAGLRLACDSLCFTAGEETVIELQAVDVEGRNFSGDLSSTDDLELDISGPGPANGTLMADIAGRYRLCWRAMITGHYQVSIASKSNPSASPLSFSVTVVSSPLAHGPSCVVHEPSHAVASEPALFKIALHDRYGNKLDTGSAKVEVRPAGIIEPAMWKSSARDLTNGIFEIDISIERAGRWAFMVLVDGCVAGIGLFHVDVIAAAASPKTSMLKCHSDLFAGSELAATLQAFDAFGNAATASDEELEAALVPEFEGVPLPASLQRIAPGSFSLHSGTEFRIPLRCEDSFGNTVLDVEGLRATLLGPVERADLVVESSDGGLVASGRVTAAASYRLCLHACGEAVEVPFVISPGPPHVPATRISLAARALVAGDPVSAAVELFDKFGNPVPIDAGAVTGVACIGGAEVPIRAADRNSRLGMNSLTLSLPSVEPHAASSKCSIEPALVSREGTIDLRVTAIDRYGNERRQGGDAVALLFEPSDGLSSSVVDNSDGSYSITVTGMRGSVDLSVFINDELVGGGPLQLDGGSGLVAWAAAELQSDSERIPAGSEAHGRLLCFDAYGAAISYSDRVQVECQPECPVSISAHGEFSFRPTRACRHTLRALLDGKPTAGPTASVEVTPASGTPSLSAMRIRPAGKGRVEAGTCCSILVISTDRFGNALTAGGLRLGVRASRPGAADAVEFDIADMQDGRYEATARLEASGTYGVLCELEGAATAANLSLDVIAGSVARCEFAEGGSPRARVRAGEPVEVALVGYDRHGNACRGFAGQLAVSLGGHPLAPAADRGDGAVARFALEAVPTAGRAQLLVATRLQPDAPLLEMPVEVVAGTPCAPASRLSPAGPLAVQAGLPALARLALRDRFGNACDPSGVEAVVRAVDAAGEEVPVQLEAGTGLLRAVFERAGRGAISATLGGEAVGAPVELDVLPGPASAASSRVESLPVEWRAGRPASFRLLVSDRFGNSSPTVASAAVVAAWVECGAPSGRVEAHALLDGCSHVLTADVKRAGAARLHVTLGGEPVSGSPFPLLVQPGGASSVLARVPPRVLAGAPLRLELRPVDEHMNAASEELLFSLAPGAGGPVVPVPREGPCRLVEAGRYRLRARRADGSEVPAQGALECEVCAGPPALERATLTGLPASLSAGEAAPVAARLFDAHGNACTELAAVAVAVSGPSGRTTVALRPASEQGAYEGSLELTAAGSYTATLTVGGAAASARPHAFRVLPGPLAEVRATLPAAGTAGEPLRAVLEALDAHGNARPASADAADIAAALEPQAGEPCAAAPLEPADGRRASAAGELLTAVVSLKDRCGNAVAAASGASAGLRAWARCGGLREPLALRLRPDGSFVASLALRKAGPWDVCAELPDGPVGKPARLEVAAGPAHAARSSLALPAGPVAAGTPVHAVLRPRDEFGNEGARLACAAATLEVAGCAPVALPWGPWRGARPAWGPSPASRPASARSSSAWARPARHPPRRLLVSPGAPAAAAVELRALEAAACAHVPFRVALFDACGNAVGVPAGARVAVAWHALGSAAAGTALEAGVGSDGAGSFSPALAAVYSPRVSLDGAPLATRAPLLRVRPGRPHGPNCTVQLAGGASQLTAGAAATALITCFDAAGNRVSCGGDDVAVLLRAPAVGDIAARTTDHGDGTYTASGPLTAAGEYALLASVAGVPCGQEPPRLHVAPGPAVGRHSLLSAPGEAAAGAEARLELVCRDQFLSRCTTGGDRVLVEVDPPCPTRLLDRADGGATTVRAVVNGSAAPEAALAVRAGPVCPAACSLEELPGGALPAGGELRFAVAAADACGNRLPAAACAAIEVAAAGPEALQSHLFYDHEGRACCVLRPTKAGPYSVSVAIGGEPVRGSPFAAEVLPGAPEPSSCTLALAAAAGPAGCPVAVRVEARDAFGNAAGAASLLADLRLDLAAPGSPAAPLALASGPGALASFLPTRAGRYSVRALIGGRPLAGTAAGVPFECEPAEVYPPRCTAEWLGEPSAAAGERLSCALQLCDRFGNEVRASSAAVEGVVRAADGAQLARAELVSVVDGRCLLSVACRAAGRHQLVLAVAGRELPAPLPLLVRPGRACAARCLVEGAPEGPVEAGATLALRLVACDAFGNAVGRGGEALEAVARGAGAEVRGGVVDGGDGVYALALRATRAGEYRLEVALAGEPVPAAPPSFCVARAPPSPSAAASRARRRAPPSPARRPASPSSPPTPSATTTRPRRRARGEPRARRAGHRRPVAVRHCGGGRYELAYRVEAAGPWRLRVAIGGRPVPGSPFPVDIAPGAPCPERCTASGAGLVSGGVAGIPVVFTLRFHDRFGNALRSLPAEAAASLRAEAGPGTSAEARDAGDGSAAVTVVSREAAPLRVRVFALGAECAGSPFPLTILDNLERWAAKELEARAGRHVSAVRTALGGSRATVRALRGELAELGAAAGRDLAAGCGQILTAVSQQAAELANARARYAREIRERRKLYNELQELRGNIRVFVRVRPLSAAELAGGARPVVEFPQSDTIRLTVAGAGGSRPTVATYDFDRVYGPETGQAAVFEDTRSLVTSVLDGYNVCLFAYGQTGSGKTFTMEGTDEEPGVSYRALEELFRTTGEEASPDYRFEVRVSLLEVYNESIRDLLRDPSERPVPLDVKLVKRHDGTLGVHVPDLRTSAVASVGEVREVMARGYRNRAVGVTDLNSHSSRSHCVLTVYVDSSNVTTGLRACGKLHLVDLAGSERVKDSGAAGARLQEAQNINRSLSALSNVINALVTKAKHVPFRDSKLTRLLEDSIGGNSKCLMFCNLNPSADWESYSSLKFAARVRAVELGPARRTQEVLAAPEPVPDENDEPAPPRPSFDSEAPPASPAKPPRPAAPPPRPLSDNSDRPAAAAAPPAKPAPAKAGATAATGSSSRLPSLRSGLPRAASKPS
eukprot:tig00000342_g24230.t1